MHTQGSHQGEGLSCGSMRARRDEKLVEQPGRGACRAPGRGACRGPGRSARQDLRGVSAGRTPGDPVLRGPRQDGLTIGFFGWADGPLRCRGGRGSGPECRRAKCGRCRFGSWCRVAGTGWSLGEAICPSLRRPVSEACWSGAWVSVGWPEGSRGTGGVRRRGPCRGPLGPKLGG